MARTLDLVSKREKSRKRADRNALNQLPKEVVIFNANKKEGNMARTLDLVSKREKSRKRADRNAFNQLSEEARTEFHERLGEAMVRFNETFWKILCEVADTHRHEVKALITKYGVEAVRHFLEHTHSDYVDITLMDFFSDQIR